MRKDTGVIVGRFQVQDLHPAHGQLIEEVMSRHERVIIFLGVSPVPVTKNNPLDFITRKEMILERFPGLTVLAIPDHPSDREWSKELDKRIREECPGEPVMLYGSKESFLRSYSGQFPVHGLEQALFVSNVVERRSSPNFRAGVIFAVNNQYSKVYPTVDAAVFHEGRLLLARKPGVTGYRFIGGFTDPSDDSYESALEREVKEEANIEIDDIRYVGSAKIDDWRYRNEEDKITTLLFTARFTGGAITPQDDISELRWFDWEELEEDAIVDEHKILFNILKEKVSDKSMRYDVRTGE